MIKSSFFKIVALGAVLIFAASCKKKDDAPVDTTPPTGVADGYYINKIGTSPVPGNLLSVVKDESGNVDLNSTYTFLSAGNYLVSNVVDNNIVESYTGVKIDTADFATSDGDKSSWGFNTIGLIKGYTVASTTSTGFAIANDGFYQVTLEPLSKEIVIYKIENAEVLGSSTEGGWGSYSDQVLSITGTPSASNVELKLDTIKIDKGKFKVRLNGRWKIKRPTYVILTNYGGSTTNFAPGGADISVAGALKGYYEFTLFWTPALGTKVAARKVKDVVVVPIDPTQLVWGITGPFNNGWGVDDAIMTYSLVGTAKTWTATNIPLKADEGKFRANEEWVKELGFTDVTIEGPDADLLEQGGGTNFKLLEAGNYTIVLSTSDEGDTYTLNITQVSAAVEVARKMK